MKVVIVGGNTAGISAARSLLRNDLSCRITLIEKESLTPYAACSMSDFIAGKIPTWRQLHGRIEDFYGTDRIELKTAFEAVEIHHRERIVTIANAPNRLEEVPYDYLILALGATAMLPPIESKGDRVFSFKTLQDAIRLATFIERGAPRTIHVVGAGPIGVSLSLALRNRGFNVTLVDKLLHPIAWLDPELGQRLIEILESFGVGFRGNFSIGKLSQNSDRISIRSTDNLEIEGNAVVCTLGFKPCSELASRAGLSIGKTGAVTISSSFKTSNDRILAGGDCTEARHLLTRKPIYTPQASRAAMQGKFIAYTLLGRRMKPPLSLGTIIHGFGKQSCGTTGINHQILDSADGPISKLVLDFPKRERSLSENLRLAIYYKSETQQLCGVQAVGHDAANIVRQAVPAVALGLRLEDLVGFDLGYHPQFGPLWHPLAVICRQAMKEL